jgi:hypothetical protein
MLWAGVAAWFFAQEIVEHQSHEFVFSVGYYLIVWGGYVLAIVGGVLVVMGHWVGKWLVVLTASELVFQKLWVWLAYGPESPTLGPQAAIAVSFAVTVCVMVFLRQPNPPVYADAEPHPPKWTPEPNARGSDEQ